MRRSLAYCNRKFQSSVVTQNLAYSHTSRFSVNIWCSATLQPLIMNHKRYQVWQMWDEEIEFKILPEGWKCKHVDKNSRTGWLWSISSWIQFNIETNDTCSNHVLIYESICEIRQGNEVSACVRQITTHITCIFIFWVSPNRIYVGSYIVYTMWQRRLKNQLGILVTMSAMNPTHNVCVNAKSFSLAQ